MLNGLGRGVNLFSFCVKVFGNFVCRGISPVYYQSDGLVGFVNFYKAFYGRG
jgi:hypothetical protein